MPRTERAPFWVPVLLYHRVVPRLPAHDPYGNCVSAAAFEAHLAWLRRRGYHDLTLSDLGLALLGEARLPRRPVVITFDDGYRDNHDVALPLLRQYGFRATVFLVSGAIGADSRFDAAFGYEPVPMLDAKQVHAMQRAGIEFGSHSVSHPASLEDLEDGSLEDELRRSRADLEVLLDTPVTAFSYPHSRAGARVERAVASAGYRFACAGVGTRFDPLWISRVATRAATGAGLEARCHWRGLKSWARRRAA